jgi:DNA mismatch repair ATPase MutS
VKSCTPEFIGAAKKEMVAKNIYHPLIKGCVKNDLTVKDKSIMITGSNMSGKTTFLRTVVINSILAQTIFTCFADEFQSPMLRQYTSIRIDDDVLEGKSYYYQEVNTMGALIEEVHSPLQNLFLLDEVFKGTNTVERIASAKAALSYLNKGANIVIVSTHDLELPAMLQYEYDLYHFSETVENEKLNFDHKMKSGPLMAGNAIRILEISKYPKEIIREARELSHTLSST